MKLIFRLFSEGKAIPMQDLEKPLGLQEAEVLGIRRQSVLRICRL